MNFALAVDGGRGDEGGPPDYAQSLATKLVMAAQAAGHDSGKSPTEFLILVAPEAASGRGRPAAVVESGKNVVRIGESWMVLDDLKGAFVTQATDPDSWLVAWRAGPSNLSPSLSRAADEVASDFWQFLKQLEEPKEVTPAALAAAMEAVASLWHIHSPALVLLPEDRRIGDAFARLLGELAATEQPPRSVVHEAAAWLAEKLGVFTDEFAKAAGSFTGKTAALGAGVGLAWATGKAGDLANAVRNLWEMVR